MWGSYLFGKHAELLVLTEAVTSFGFRMGFGERSPQLTLLFTRVAVHPVGRGLQEAETSVGPRGWDVPRRSTRWVANASRNVDGERPRKEDDFPLDLAHLNLCRNTDSNPWAQNPWCAQMRMAAKMGGAAAPAAASIASSSEAEKRRIMKNCLG